VGIAGIRAFTVRRLLSRDEDEPQDVVFLVGPPRSTFDIADELEREQAAKAEQAPRQDGGA
jgi:hypothetical protein